MAVVALYTALNEADTPTWPTSSPTSSTTSQPQDMNSRIRRAAGRTERGEEPLDLNAASAAYEATGTVSQRFRRREACKGDADRVIRLSKCLASAARYAGCPVRLREVRVSLPQGAVVVRVGPV